MQARKKQQINIILNISFKKINKILMKVKVPYAYIFLFWKLYI